MAWTQSGVSIDELAVVESRLRLICKQSYEILQITSLYTKHTQLLRSLLHRFREVIDLDQYVNVLASFSNVNVCSFYGKIAFFFVSDSNKLRPNLYKPVNNVGISTSTSVVSQHGTKMWEILEHRGSFQQRFAAFILAWTTFVVSSRSLMFLIMGLASKLRVWL